MLLLLYMLGLLQTGRYVNFSPELSFGHFLLSFFTDLYIRQTYFRLCSIFFLYLVLFRRSNVILIFFHLLFPSLMVLAFTYYSIILNFHHFQEWILFYYFVLISSEAFKYINFVFSFIFGSSFCQEFLSVMLETAFKCYLHSFLFIGINFLVTFTLSFSFKFKISQIFHL